MSGKLSGFPVQCAKLRRDAISFLVSPFLSSFCPSQIFARYRKAQDICSMLRERYQEINLQLELNRRISRSNQEIKKINFGRRYLPSSSMNFPTSKLTKNGTD